MFFDESATIFVLFAMAFLAFVSMYKPKSFEEPEFQYAGNPKRYRHRPSPLRRNKNKELVDYYSIPGTMERDLVRDRKKNKKS